MDSILLIFTFVICWLTYICKYLNILINALNHLFLDALLADLQNSSRISQVPPPIDTVNGHEHDETGTPGKPFSYSPIPPRKPDSSVSDLDSLLDDLADKSMLLVFCIFHKRLK